jgi:hypothetical protein
MNRAMSMMHTALREVSHPTVGKHSGILCNGAHQ